MEEAWSARRRVDPRCPAPWLTSPRQAATIVRDQVYKEYGLLAGPWALHKPTICYSLSLLWASWVEEGRPAKSGLTEPYDSKGGVADREGGNASRVLMIYDLFTIQI